VIKSDIFYNNFAPTIAHIVSQGKK